VPNPPNLNPAPRQENPEDKNPHNPLYDFLEGLIFEGLIFKPNTAAKKNKWRIDYADTALLAVINSNANTLIDMTLYLGAKQERAMIKQGRDAKTAATLRKAFIHDRMVYINSRFKNSQLFQKHRKSNKPTFESRVTLTNINENDRQTILKGLNDVTDKSKQVEHKQTLKIIGVTAPKVGDYISYIHDFIQDQNARISAKRTTYGTALSSDVTISTDGFFGGFQV